MAKNSDALRSYDPKGIKVILSPRWQAGKGCNMTLDISIPRPTIAAYKLSTHHGLLTLLDFALCHPEHSRQWIGAIQVILERRGGRHA